MFKCVPVNRVCCPHPIPSVAVGLGHLHVFRRAECARYCWLGPVPLLFVLPCRGGWTRLKGTSAMLRQLVVLAVSVERAELASPPDPAAVVGDILLCLAGGPQLARQDVALLDAVAIPPAAENLEDQVAAAAVFSPNEDGEDVPTAALPLALVPHLHARGLTLQPAARQRPGSSAEEEVQREPRADAAATAARRLTRLRAARTAHERFLAHVRRLRVLPPAERALLASITTREEGGAADADGADAHIDASGVLRGARASDGLPADPAARRAAKIARYKRDRAAAADVRGLAEAFARRVAVRQPPLGGRGGRGGGGAGGAETVGGDRGGGHVGDDGAGDGGGGGGQDDDRWGEEEEAARQLAVGALAAAVRQSVDALPLLDEEVALLAYAADAAARGEAVPPPPPQGPTATERLGLPANFRIGVPPDARSGGAGGTREPVGGHTPVGGGLTGRAAVAAGVFRPSHALPTYTVEEWGEFEAARATDKAAADGAAKAAAAAAAAAEDPDRDDAVADRDTMAAREWDDWKGENNRGSGNTLR